MKLIFKLKMRQNKTFFDESSIKAFNMFEWFLVRALKRRK